MKFTYALFTMWLLLLLAACAPAAAPKNESTGGGGGDTDDPTDLPSDAHDGTPASPVSLTIGEAFTGKIGANESDDEHAYYQFTTDDDEDYVFSVTGSSPALTGTNGYEVIVFDDASWTIPQHMAANEYLPDAVAVIVKNLTPNATHNILVWNPEAVNTTYSLKVEKLSGITLSEGSSAVPIELDNTPIAGSFVVAGVNGHRASYYHFTANQAGELNITLPYGGTLFSAYLYANSNLTSSLASSSSTDGATGVKTITATVSASQEIWLELYNNTTTLLIRGDIGIEVAP